MISFNFIVLQYLKDQNFVVRNQISESQYHSPKKLTSWMMDSFNLLIVHFYHQESARIVSLSHLERVQFEKKI